MDKLLFDFALDQLKYPQFIRDRIVFEEFEKNVEPPFEIANLKIAIKEYLRNLSKPRANSPKRIEFTSQELKSVEVLVHNCYNDTKLITKEQYRSLKNHTTDEMLRFFLKNEIIKFSYWERKLRTTFSHKHRTDPIDISSTMREKIYNLLEIYRFRKDIPCITCDSSGYYKYEKIKNRIIKTEITKQEFDDNLK
jgi:hypothetical protein